jgi:hypothetical protein
VLDEAAAILSPDGRGEGGDPAGSAGGAGGEPTRALGGGCAGGAATPLSAAGRAPADPGEVAAGDGIGVTVGARAAGGVAGAGAVVPPWADELDRPAALRMIATVAIAANTEIATRPSASIIRRDSAGIRRGGGGCAATTWPPEYDIGWTCAVEVASRPG